MVRHPVAVGAIRCRPVPQMRLGYAQHPFQRFDRSASRGGLSQRMRLMRGKAHGDAGLVAGGALQALEGDLEHQALCGSCATARTGPKRSMVLSRTNLSSCFSSSSVKPK